MKKFKRLLKSVTALLLTIALLLPMIACGNDPDVPKDKDNDQREEHNVTINQQNPGQYWDDVPGDGTNTGDPKAWNKEETPNINITVIGGDKELPEKEQELGELADENAEIYSMVFSAVQVDLKNAGFEVSAGVAQSEYEDGYSALGLYYVDRDVNLFSSNQIMSCGFVEIVDDEDDYYDAFRSNELIYVIDTDTIEGQTSQEDDLFYVYSYNYENIHSYHFIYQNKYITYYQESEMRVKYTVQDNVKENYDLLLGSLYNYDTDRYVYDDSIFDEYQTHSGMSLFSEEDYTALELLMKEQVAAQEQAGYYVEELTIVYISPEAIQTYLLSDEEETFFGYSVSALTESFGLGTALTYTANGFEASSVLKYTEQNYNWKSFLIKCGIGCGIILVGAVLTPITGGVSFGCALLTISKVTVTFALTSALGTLATETASGLLQGKTIEEALKSATCKGLTSFANGFMIGAAIASVGVVSGIIKPVACFAAGTPVLVGYVNGTAQYQTVENINVGDYVYSYNEESGSIEQNIVSEVFVHEVNELVELTINDSVIPTTANHPFYSADRCGWVEAGNLCVGEKVLSANGEAIVAYKNVIEIGPVNVYNFTVDNAHTYFVGEASVCVHNQCNTLGSKRNKAVSDAWKQEVQNVKNGTSKYNWSPSEVAELLKKGKISGYEGHHIVPVNELIGTAKEALISSADDIVFLSVEQHVAVHAVGDTLEATLPVLKTIVPWIAERLALLL